MSTPDFKKIFIFHWFVCGLNTSTSNYLIQKKILDIYFTDEFQAIRLFLWLIFLPKRSTPRLLFIQFFTSTGDLTTCIMVNRRGPGGEGRRHWLFAASQSGCAHSLYNIQKRAEGTLTVSDGGKGYIVPFT